MRYSILLPYYDPQYAKTEKFSKLIRSIVRNATTDDYEFVVVKDGPSYAESHNKAFQNAKGEHFIIFNDDIEVLDPKFIEKFTSEDSIRTWKGTAHAWSMSRRVYEQVGGMDEQFKNGFNCEDTDYFHRASLAGFKLEDAEVDLKHDHNQVVYGNREKNKELFFSKWGFQP